MRLIKRKTSWFGSQPSPGRRWRQFCALSLAALSVGGLAGCGGPIAATDIAPILGLGGGGGSSGIVAADEPRAAIVGRDILGAGGNAADAATAMYFALAATMPLSASLAGGGACIVHPGQGGPTQAVEFWPAAAVASSNHPAGHSAGHPAGMIPGNPRGFFALQARYGRLPWAQDVLPGARLAGSGVTVSRSLARDLEAAGPALRQDAEAVRLFSRPDGTPLQEGDQFQEPALATTLNAIAAKGPGDFYAGLAGSRFIEATRTLGLPVGPGDLNAYRAQWTDAAQLAVGDLTLQLPPTGSTRLWGLFSKPDLYKNADAVTRALVFANPAAAAPAGSGEVPGGAGFIALDGDGGAVACAVTLNGIPGQDARLIPGTGLFMPAAPGNRGWSAAVLVDRPATGKVAALGSASGGPAATAALVQNMAAMLIDGKSAEEALAVPRVANLGGHGQAEALVKAEVTSELGGRDPGFQVVKALGRVNLGLCTESGCSLQPDPRFWGLAQSVVK